MELGIGGLSHATEIGAGASAVVYKAVQVDLDREVAVKVLSATDEAFVRRFHREAKTLGKLSLNPGIVTVHGSGVTNAGHPYLILELCESSVLDRLKSEGPFEPETACRVGAQVADAVSDAHKNGVIHRDIKPANLLRSQTGRYLITDFGISTVHGSTLGQTDSIGFTAGYVAPETLRGEEIGPPSDVYALGATLFHMLAGHPPFVDRTGNSNLLALAQRVINDPIPDLRPYGVPDDISRIVEAAMAKQPADRPSAAQLRDQLQAAAEQSRTPQFAAFDPTNGETAADQATVNDGFRPTAPIDQQTAASTAIIGGQADLTRFGTGPGDSLAPPATDATTAMDATAAMAVPPQINANPQFAGQAGQPSRGVLADASTSGPVPPGRANYPLPPHSDDGPTPWKMVVLGFLAASVVLLGGIALVLNRGDNNGVDTTDEAADPASPDGDASEQGGGDGSDSGIANSLPGETSTTVEGAVMVTVPDVTGQTEGGARSRLVGQGFEVLVQERASATAVAGTVVAQEPTGLTEAEEGSVILLFIAVEAEPDTIDVPTLAGLTEPAAVSELQAVGLEPGETIFEFSEDVPINEVIRSAPPELTSVDEGTPIVLIVSKGPPPPACADLVGLTEAEATGLIEASNLTAAVTRVEDETVPDGQVMSCTVDGDTINLTVSDGPEICGTVIGMPLADGTTALENKGYTVTATGEVRTDLTAGEIFECTKQTTTAAITYAEGLPDECPASVVGSTAAEARTALEAAGFTDITVTQAASDTVTSGTVISCDVANGSVSVVVSTGPEIQTGNLVVTLESLQIEGPCAGDGLQPDLYGVLSISYGGTPKPIWANRQRGAARTPDANGELEFDVDRGWANTETGQDLVVSWDLKDADNEGRAGDEDGVDDDVSAVSRTLTLDGGDRPWRPPSDANDACSLELNVSIEWRNLSS